MNWRRSFGCRILRWERGLWVLLAVLAAASLAALPHVRLAFGLKGVMRQGHPSRERLESFEREFQLGETLVVFLEGERLFTAQGLRAVRDLSGQLDRTEGVQRVFSAVDLMAPAARDGHLRIVPLLGATTLSSDSATRDTLASPPFSDRWFGYLYDRQHRVLALAIRCGTDTEDPWRTVGLLEAVERRLRELRDRTGIEYHLNGLFYLNGEMIRSTFRDQGKLTLAGVTLLTGCFWILLGDLATAGAVMFVLGISVLLAFGVMIATGLPLNGLSGNLPVLTLVNGLEDVIYILAAFYVIRERAGRRRSAACAARDCLLPNFLTSFATFGALIVTGATDMLLLQSFGWAICIGVVVEYVVAIVYLPLLLARLPGAGTRALYYRLEEALARRWLESWWRFIRSPATLAGFALVGCGLVAFGSGSVLNANWFRYFVKQHPMTGTLEFLRARGFPVTSLDCTIRAAVPLEVLLSSPESRAELAEVARAIGAVPGVSRVDSLGNVRDFIDERMAKVDFGAGLTDTWRRARREAVFRQYQELGAFEDFYSTASGKLRLVVATDLEDANSLVALGQRVTEAARAAGGKTVQGASAAVAGSMAYWSDIMDYLRRTFFQNAATSCLFVFVTLLAMTRSLPVALLSMVTNTLPLAVMFCVARALGHDLNESFCILDSLAVGNSVNDTIQYLTHVQANLRKGLTYPEALRAGFREVGCAIVLSSLLVAVGFCACFFAEGLPVVLSGVYLGAACLSAVVFDVFLHPALLSRLNRW
ncbi:MAG: MMPL family transporter [Candidatus Wallbacteria bacterium]|nr:MMPL family transporter [Candidatus Wallbacteria bacterium]